MEQRFVTNKNDVWKSTGLDRETWDMTGAYIPEREPSMRPCHGIFTDRFIFWTVVVRTFNTYLKILTMHVDNAKKISVTQN